jgi:ABC-type multidrug transport system fused ATPase/permease subunit
MAEESIFDMLDEKDISLLDETMRKVDYKEAPIQLIDFHGSTFKLNQEALEIISSIEEDIIVVAVVGKARTGKSYLMNLLLDNIGRNKGVINYLIILVCC